MIHATIRGAAFALVLLAPTQAGATLPNCAANSLYAQSDAKSGFLVHWRERILVEIPSHADMEAIFQPSYKAATPNMRDCSSSGVKCTAMYEGPAEWVVAIREGKKGDKYRVSKWTFTLNNDLAYKLDDPGRLVWVSFVHDHPDAGQGHLLFDTRRGVISISRGTGPSGYEATEVLVSGPGFFAPSPCADD